MTLLPYDQVLEGPCRLSFHSDFWLLPSSRPLLAPGFWLLASSSPDPDKLLQCVTIQRHQAASAPRAIGHFTHIQIAARVGPDAVGRKEIPRCATVFPAKTSLDLTV